MLWRATVQRENTAKPIGFSPQHQQAQAGDALFWFNDDEKTDHWPEPDSDSENWNLLPIIAKKPSDQLSLGTPGTYPYHCKNHPEEKGSIIVSNAVLIAAGADPLFGSTQIIVGQTVSWGNSDTQPHQPAPVNGEPWVAPVGSGDLSAPVYFRKIGNFDYHCAKHPNNPAEKGTIRVAALVTIDKLGSLLPTVTIARGDGVVWRNNDRQNPHRPTPDSGTAWFNNPIASRSFSSVVIFNKAGEIFYSCAFHGGENGTIIVT